MRQSSLGRHYRIKLAQARAIENPDRRRAGMRGCRYHENFCAAARHGAQVLGGKGTSADSGRRRLTYFDVPGAYADAAGAYSDAEQRGDNAE